MISLILLLIYFLIAILIYIYIFYRDKVWLRYIWHTIAYRLHVRRFKLNLKSMDETTRTLALVEWLDSDFWFNKYWFGRSMKKIVIKEFEKLSK